jgi:DNA end-binding protein Ku
VTLEKEDFKKANVEASQTVDIAGFVERESLPAFFFEAPYYLAPGKHGDKGYALLRETLIRTGRVGIATVVIRTRAHLAALYAVDNVLVLNTLRYANELRDPKELKVPEDLKAAKVNEREIDMAERLVEDMARKWDPTAFHDTYRDDLLKMIEEKASGKVRKEPKAKPAREAEVIDFASLLEKSLGARKGAGKSAGAANDEHHAVKRKPAAKARRKAAPKSGAAHRRAA